MHLEELVIHNFRGFKDYTYPLHIDWEWTEENFEKLPPKENN